ncbi:M14 family metallopeptidase [Acinetobacter soli]|uniref:M14 family metallopeptidase n=1 Tax=Acinetobacter soli TaxID=487316 RepID=UPI001250AF3E|nr:M14 family metallopeptidase [Acinetobacter soli]
MADSIITKQELIDAQKDAETLEQVTSADKNTTVVSRLGRQYPSLSKALQTIIDTGGFKPYSTEAELKASVPLIAPSAAYAFDTKKVWLWNGSAWVDEGTSALDQAKQFTEDVVYKEIKNLTLSEIMQSAFFTYNNVSICSVIISENNKIVLPHQEITNHEIDFLNNYAFFTYKTASKGAILLSSNFRIVLPVEAKSEFELTSQNLEDAKFNSFYLGADIVKKRFDRHPIQDVSNTADYWSGSVEKLYAQYDKLITNYPTYIEKELLGNEPTGLPIYAYSFKPTKKLLRVHEQSVMDYPKVVIIGGVHGNERGCQITNLTFFTMLCESYLQSEVLTYLRHNVEFYLIPASNAWGVQNGKRFNSNYVDLNRNFDSNWKAGTGIVSNESFTYGTSAFSEIESQITRDYVLKHADACLVLDTHDGGSADYFAWIATMHQTMIEVFKKSSYEIITMIYQDLHPLSVPAYPLLFAGHEDGTMTKWAMMQGIKSGLLETNGDNTNFNNDVNIKRDIFLKVLQILFKNAVDSHIQNLILGAENA